MSKSQVDAVDTYTAAVHNLMRAARLAKPAQTIEPPLTYADLSVEIKEVLLGSDNDAPTIGQAQYAAIETAFRNVFYHLIVRLHTYNLSPYAANNVLLLRPLPRLTTLRSAKSGISSTSFSYSPIKVGATSCDDMLFAKF